MKKNIIKIFILFFILTVGVGSSLSAQNYFSKPEASKNLADAAKYLSSTLSELEESNEDLYKVNKEKLRFIKKMQIELKSSNSIQEAVDKVLPKKI